jgi:hypothetical protein
MLIEKTFDGVVSRQQCLMGFLFFTVKQIDAGEFKLVKGLINTLLFTEGNKALLRIRVIPLLETVARQLCFQLHLRTLCRTDL